MLWFDFLEDSARKAADQVNSDKQPLRQHGALHLDPSASDQKALSMPSFTVTQALVDLLAVGGGKGLEHDLSNSINTISKYFSVLCWLPPNILGSESWHQHFLSENSVQILCYSWDRGYKYHHYQFFTEFL